MNTIFPNNIMTKPLEKNMFANYIKTSFANNLIEDLNCKYYTETEVHEKLTHDSFETVILNLNIRSLDKHCGDLSTMLQNFEYKIDFITLSEIGAKNLENMAVIFGNRYDMEFQMPKKGNFGGSCILIRNELKYVSRDDLGMKCELVEDVWIETELHDQKIIIGSVYRHPNTDVDIFIQCFEVVLEKLQNEDGKVFICGDFNIDALKSNSNSRTMEYYNTVLTQNFLPTITLPTRITESSATIIDNIFMKLDNNTLNDKMESGNIYSDITDHLPNILMIKSEKIIADIPGRPYVRLQGPKNISKFKEILSNENFNEILDEQDPNCILEYIYDIYKKAYEESFPLHMLSRKKMKDKKWMTPAIRKSINQKSKLYKIFLHYPNEQNRTNYKIYRNILTGTIRKAKELYYSKLIDDKNKNFRALWEIFSPVINPKKFRKKAIDKIVHNGHVFNSNKGIADALNDHFVNIGKNLAHTRDPTFNNSNDFKNYLNEPCDRSIFLFPTSKNEIKKIVNDFKNKKAPGDDAISNKLLKHFSNLIPLEHLVNQILKTGKYPEMLKYVFECTLQF
jgi:hypothetical protein